MTTEDDFQAALDANPDDWQTRLVFADWLQDRNDPRAEGYRALGVRRRCPFISGNRQAVIAWWSVRSHLHWLDRSPQYGTCDLPCDWFDHLDVPDRSSEYAPDAGRIPKTGFVYPRSECEDAAALAFSQLPPDRRAELLNPSPP